MNLEDVIDPEYGLQQDEWSLSKPTFGEEGQLEVVGWSGKYGRAKYYILRCNKCSQDSELFGEGYFRSLKQSLIKGQAPCGCGKAARWSKGQYLILCRRAATELDYRFIGFIGEWAAARTKIKMLCEKHGEWGTGNINSLTSKGSGCPECRKDAISTGLNTKPDDVMIASFFSSGAFHSDTKFSRTSKDDLQGVKAYWSVSCPECKECYQSLSGNLQQGKRSCKCGRDYALRTIMEANRKPDDTMVQTFFSSNAFHPDTKFWRGDRPNYWGVYCPCCEAYGQSFSGSLRKGHRPCACSPHRQQECYINWLVDEHNNSVAIKFGIANNSKQRIKQQNSKCVYSLKQHSVYSFPSVASCKQAERECKEELETGVVLKRDMPDGYSETTWAYNIGKVKSIYERNGGVLV